MVANRLIMEVYAHPLEVYLRGSSFARMIDGEPRELVHAFFADRLDRDGFILDWLRSGRRFRHWLVVAFRYFLLEELRRRSRGHWGRGHHDAEASSPDPGPYRGYNREVALRLVRAALEEAARTCRAEGLDVHWRLFEDRHVHHIEPHISRERLNLTPERAKVLYRTAQNHFKRAMRGLVAWPGATPEEIDDEIMDLMEGLKP